ncbi:MAG: YigZ family protein [Bacteroidetes bacterium HGW-Bacteroidetes-20]|nr:MAG: YigZ family protein [Bacteroidetes bacterium HGW-Bacteroidetes-20]
MFEDTYHTIESITEGVFRAKGSKFISIAMPVTSENEIKEKLGEIKKIYFDARHFCYAYILGFDKSAYRINDDGEPSGTAGRPIYGQLLSKDLTNILVVVVRYFGGTKLGVSGLIHAYKEATKDALEAAKIIEKTVDESYLVTLEYEQMNKVMQILKNDYVKITNQSFQDGYTIEFVIRKREADKIVFELRKIDCVNVSVIK